MTAAGIRRITTAAPPYDVHVALLECTSGMFYVCRSLVPVRDKARESTIDTLGSLDRAALLSAVRLPAAAKQMELFEHFVPGLSRCRLDSLVSAGKSIAVFAVPPLLARYRSAAILGRNHIQSSCGLRRSRQNRDN